MTFQRVIEMTLKPPFKYFIVKEGYFGAVIDELCFNSLSKAKETAEELFLETKMLFTIYSVKYVNDDWQTRAGWLCGDILFNLQEKADNNGISKDEWKIIEDKFGYLLK